MNIGYTFDESILEDLSIHTLLETLTGLYTSVEIAPDKSLATLQTYKQVVQSAKAFHVHVPYFVKDKIFDFSVDYQRDYEKLFIIVDSLRQYSIKRPSIVLHGSHWNATLKGMDYLLNFIVKKHVDVTLTLENTDQFWTPAAIESLVNTFQHSQLGFCYDVAHDFYGLNTGLKDLTPDYIHLHGKDQTKHQSIKYLPLDIIKSLPKNVDINLELLKRCQPDYLKHLVGDMKSLKNSLWS